MRLHIAAALAAALLGTNLSAASSAQAQVNITITSVLAPPPLPFYVQTPCPAPGYLWAPGYWAWDGFDYYWVSAAWVLPPAAGLLWTPGYWSWRDNGYIYNAGYWGPHVGFYGGVVYGFGYTGFGYEGGYWRGGGFFYNRTVNNITNIHITNVYNKTVTVNSSAGAVSYNGGKGGIVAAPTPIQLSATHEAHIQPTANQLALEHAAHKNPQAFAKANNGKPPAMVQSAQPHITQPAKAQALKLAAAPAPAVQSPLAKRNLLATKPLPAPKMITPLPKLAIAAPQPRSQLAGDRAGAGPTGD